MRDADDSENGTYGGSTVKILQRVREWVGPLERTVHILRTVGGGRRYISTLFNAKTCFLTLKLI